MFGTVVAWLIAGQPAHYLYFLAALYALAEYVLPRTTSVQARSVIEAFANVLRTVPGVGTIFERFGTPRTPPDTVASPSAGPLTVLVLLSLGLGACAAFYRQPVALQHAESDALGCATKGVAQGMAQISPSVLDALAGDSPDWQHQLDGLAATGAGVLECAVAHALFDALGTDGVKAIADLGLERAVERRLALADASALPLPTPTRRVLARGLAFLHDRIPARRAVR